MQIYAPIRIGTGIIAFNAISNLIIRKMILYPTILLLTV